MPNSYYIASMLKECQRPLLAVLIIALLLSLSACAFRLRNRNELPPQLHTLYIQAEEPYSAFQTALQASLESSDINLVDQPNQAPYILHVEKPILSYAAGTIGTSNQSRVYSVTYRVVMALENASGEVLAPMPLVTTSSLVLSANQMIQSNNQLSELVQQMQRDIISQLYNRLGSQQVKEILQGVAQPIRARGRSYEIGT